MLHDVKHDPGLIKLKLLLDLPEHLDKLYGWIEWKETQALWREYIETMPALHPNVRT
jgi:hypothetical protein